MVGTGISSYLNPLLGAIFLDVRAIKAQITVTLSNLFPAHYSIRPDVLVKFHH